MPGIIGGWSRWRRIGSVASMERRERSLPGDPLGGNADGAGRREKPSWNPPRRENSPEWDF